MDFEDGDLAKYHFQTVSKTMFYCLNCSPCSQWLMFEESTFWLSKFTDVYFWISSVNQIGWNECNDEGYKTLLDM